MTNHQFNISIFLCWLASYLIYAGVCLTAYCASVLTFDSMLIGSLVVGIVTAVLFGLLIIKTGHIGVLYGLTLAMILFTIIKIGA